MDLKEISENSMDWIHWVQNSNTIMNFGFHKMREISLLGEEASQEGLCSMELVRY
jgi:hypothetical protein